MAFVSLAEINKIRDLEQKGLLAPEQQLEYVKRGLVKVDNTEKRRVPSLNYTKKGVSERIRMWKVAHGFIGKPATKKLPILSWEFITDTDFRILYNHWHPVEALEIMCDSFPLDVEEFCRGASKFLMEYQSPEAIAARKRMAEKKAAEEAALKQLEAENKARRMKGKEPVEKPKGVGITPDTRVFVTDQTWKLFRAFYEMYPPVYGKPEL
jgi:hypothetical protein